MLFKLKPYLRISASAIGITILSLSLVACGGKEEAQKQTAIAVQLKTLESDILIDSSEYVGTLEARERVSLAPRTEGRIVQIFAQQGDRVSQGQAIVELEPTQEQEDVNAATQSVNVERARLGQNQAELRTAEANRAAAAAEVESARADLQDVEAEVELAQTNIKRSQMLVEGGALAQQELDDDNQELKSSIAQRNSRKESLRAANESLQGAQRQVEQAKATIESQKAAIRRAEAELGSISQNLAFNTINAPIDGVVGSFDDKKVGDYVSVGEQMTTITNNQNLELNINIPVEYRDRLKPGLVVETIPEAGASPIAGEIFYIAPLVNSNTQSILTKVSFPNDGNLKDREYLSVRVIWDEQPGILVPTTAVSTLGGQNFVYVASEPQPNEANNQDNSSDSQAKEQYSEVSSNGLIAEQRPVKLGSIQDQSYQIISGLEEGDEIAVSNILSLRDG
ncbi:MAG: efflux RND transporter periplasmic adaptor subunit, partial [Cyanobacteria bacterium P01_A01_bin.83]